MSTQTCRSCMTWPRSGMAVMSGRIGPLRAARDLVSARAVSRSPHQRAPEKPVRLVSASGSSVPVTGVARPPRASTALACASAAARPGPRQRSGAAGGERQAVRLARRAGQVERCDGPWRGGGAQRRLHLGRICPALGRVAADGGRIGRDETAEVVRATRLRTGAGHPLAAEGLGAHDRADLVAVDVDIADVERLGQVLDTAVDPRVKPESQAVTR